MACDPMNGLQPDQSPYKAFLNNPIIFADPTGGLEYLTIIVHNENGKEIARYNIKSPISNSSHVVSKRRDGVDGSLYREVNYYDIQTTINITLDSKKREITVNSIDKEPYGDPYLTLWGDAADAPAVIILAELYGKVPSFKIWAGGSSDDGNKKGGRRNVIEIDWASDDLSITEFIVSKGFKFKTVPGGDAPTRQYDGQPSRRSRPEGIGGGINAASGGKVAEDGFVPATYYMLNKKDSAYRGSQPFVTKEAYDEFLKNNPDVILSKQMKWSDRQKGKITTTK